MTRSKLITAIAEAACKPIPLIVSRFVLRYINGHPKEGEVFTGSNPTEKFNEVAERAEEYFVAQNHEGQTYGSRYTSRGEAETKFKAMRDREAESFKTELEKMDDAHIQSQAEYWLKEAK